MLTQSLLKKKHEVTVYDSFWYGDYLGEHPTLTKLRGDIRDLKGVIKAVKNQDAVIHLACVSNDPSFDLNPALGRSVNYDCFKDILRAVNAAEVNRFIYASSSSVYGVKLEQNVTEDMLCEPLTDYSKYKLACEMELKAYGTGGSWTIIRPATVCGYSPRMRFDLIVNILTLDAIKKRKITVHGGFQMRPNINIKDMVRAYEVVLEADEHKVNQKTYNVGGENKSLIDIAMTVRDAVRIKGIEIVQEDSKDPRSYHICSHLIKNDLGFEADRKIQGAVSSIRDALESDLLLEPLKNNDWYNIRKMKELELI
jgi:nucleoside-diphosphate-sugar epimerase